MSKKVRSLILMAIICFLLGTTITVMASSVADAFLKKDLMTIKVNGEEIEEFVDINNPTKILYPITYNNKTYLPLRNMANMLGLGITFNDNTISITDSDILYGDVNLDGIVDIEDPYYLFGYMFSASFDILGSHTPIVEIKEGLINFKECDVNLDGVVNFMDGEIIYDYANSQERVKDLPFESKTADYGNYILGDIDRNGYVDKKDLEELEYQREYLKADGYVKDLIEEGKELVYKIHNGDLNDDGITNLKDVVILARKLNGEKEYQNLPYKGEITFKVKIEYPENVTVTPREAIIGFDEELTVIIKVPEGTDMYVIDSFERPYNACSQKEMRSYVNSDKNNNYYELIILNKDVNAIITIENLPSEVEITPRRGDVNVDGTIDTKDAVLLSQYLAGWNVENQMNMYAADVNSDGKVTTKDAVLLSQYLANWDVEL